MPPPRAVNNALMPDISRLAYAIDLSSERLKGTQGSDLAALLAYPYPRSARQKSRLGGEISVAEILGPHDARRGHTDFTAAQSTHSTQCTTFTLCIGLQNVSTPGQYAKVRLVVQTMRRLDKDYSSLFIFSPTVVKASSCLLLSLAATMHLPVATRTWCVCTTDPLLRSVYVIAPADAPAHPNDMWRLQRPLYGLQGAGTHVVRHVRSPSPQPPWKVPHSDGPSCFVKQAPEGGLEGLSIVQVGDTLLTGTTNSSPARTEKPRLSRRRDARSSDTRLSNSTTPASARPLTAIKSTSTPTKRDSTRIFHVRRMILLRLAAKRHSPRLAPVLTKSAPSTWLPKCGQTSWNGQILTSLPPPFPPCRPRAPFISWS